MDVHVKKEFVVGFLVGLTSGIYVSTMYVHMITSIITIGNSRGIRIPKVLLEESGLDDKVELKVKAGEIRIASVKKLKKNNGDTLSLSQKALSADWDRPEEDEAWESLQ